MAGQESKEVWEYWPKSGSSDGKWAHCCVQKKLTTEID